MAKSKENGETPRKRGRPPAAPGEAKTECVAVWLAPHELRLIEQIAAQEGRPVSTILRMGALSWAARRLKRGFG